MNRFFPLRSYSDEGPLLKGLVCSSAVEISVVVVVGGRVVWTKSSSGNDTCVSELLIITDSYYLHPNSIQHAAVFH